MYNNNSYGNFICVFECTIVKLATNRQLTNSAGDWIIQKKKKKKERKKTSTLHQVWVILIPISTTKDVICSPNGYIYHFLHYTKLLFLSMPTSFIMSKNMEHSSEKTPRELMEKFANFTHR